MKYLIYLPDVPSYIDSLNVASFNVIPNQIEDDDKVFITSEYGINPAAKIAEKLRRDGISVESMILINPRQTYFTIRIPNNVKNVIVFLPFGARDVPIKIKDKNKTNVRKIFTSTSVGIEESTIVKKMHEELFGDADVPACN